MNKQKNPKHFQSHSLGNEVDLKKKKKTKAPAMSSIPDEIYIEILLRLPVISTLVCKSVCKNWYALISTSDFVKKHHNLTIQKTNFRLMISGFDNSSIYSLSFDPSSLSSFEFHLYGVEIIDSPLGSLDHEFQLMSSCNGLVCVWSRHRQLFSLWNPVNNEYKELPKSPNKPIHRNVFSYAFGYDSKTGDCKLICLYDHSGGSLVDVYTTGLNSWKNTQVVPYYVSEESGVLVNGVYHWLAYRMDTMAKVIISLGISSDTFKELQLPEVPLEKMIRWLSVGVLNECLCLLAYSDNIQVWVLQDYGVQESWTIHYSITNESILRDPSLRPMWSFHSGEILFVKYGRYDTNLVLYDPKDGCVRKPKVHAENQIFTFPGAMNMIILKA